ncbi:hypothetical protein C8R44DRAFT_730712 [Mycena epipterygia]|nr:hypothetical protein C8R44DRAFT_730712 [Mycena epipterygia]
MYPTGTAFDVQSVASDLPMRTFFKGLSLRSIKFGDHDGIRFNGVIGPDTVIVLIQNGVGQEEPLHKSNANAQITVKEDIQIDRWVKVICSELAIYFDFSKCLGGARSIFTKGIIVAAVKGIAIPEDTLDTMTAKYTSFSGSTSSMLTDALNMKPIEVKSTLGYPLREGLKLGISVPALTTIYSLLKAMDWKHAHPNEARL